MHYVSAIQLTKSYGVTPLFRNISFNINEGDKIGIIARNGVGKSTLLNIIAGMETPDEGKLWIHKDVSVALFEQEPVFEENKTILENIFSTNAPVMDALRRYEAAIESEDSEEMMQAIEKIDELNAWTFEAKVKEILGKLKIDHLKEVISNLSGGQRKRVALAKTLVNIGFEPKHILLMMDEPTNHLDVEMIEWLENYLDKENITLLLVTHDRYFLDAVCDEIWELERSEIYTYGGDYENYITKKAARLESEQSGIDKARNEYRKELEWMRKQPKARTTKSKSRQDNFYEVEARAKEKTEDAQLQLQMKMSRLGGKIVEMKKVYKSYFGKKILKGFDYNFAKGERIGIIGRNGTGKTTFLNILQGMERPDSGKINIGETVIFGNFSQEGLMIEENIRVIEYVKTFAENFPLAKGGSLSASQFLELFLFTPEKQYTYLNSLSGGEKKRLQLLTVLFTNPNFLILDEPTNDLDLPTLGILENFLIDYTGCILIVSHDRYFMDKLVDHLFILEGDGYIKDFPGNYSQYRIWLKGQEKINNYTNVEVKKTVNEINDINIKPETVDNKRKIGYKEKREFELLKHEIGKLETEKLQIEEELSNVESSFEVLNRLSKRMDEINNQINQKEMRWLELSELI